MLIQLLFVMLAAVNIAAYFLMWKYKVRAVRHGWRISENTFFLLIKSSWWFYWCLLRDEALSP